MECNWNILTPTSFNSWHVYLLYSWRSPTTLKNGHENSASQKGHIFSQNCQEVVSFKNLLSVLGEDSEAMFFFLFSGDLCFFFIKLVVSTHLKNMSQIWVHLPQIGSKIKTNWNQSPSYLFIFPRHPHVLLSKSDVWGPPQHLLRQGF